MEARYDESQSEHFRHKPLDHSKSSIRLVRILPALSVEGLIQCSMMHATIDATYQCLSYRWGDPLPETAIMIDGKRYCVRQNLLDFLTLRQARQQTTPCFDDPLWIDALCIDQGNNQERNHQVSQMGQIFSHATIVNIWLAFCPLLAQMCKTYAEQPPSILNLAISRGVRFRLGKGTKASPFLTHLWDIFVRFREASSLHEAEEQYQSKRHAYEEDLFDNPYWRRAWITQEIVLAQKAVLVLEWEEDVRLEDCLDLVHASRHMKHHKVLGKFARFSSHPMRTRWLAKRTTGTFEGYYGEASLTQLLTEFQDKECAIPRDRIFSLLSLYKDGHLIMVDYTLPDDEFLQRLLSLTQESVVLCIIFALARAALPRSIALGATCMEVNMSITESIKLRWVAITEHLSQTPKSPCKWRSQLAHCYKLQRHYEQDSRRYKICTDTRVLTPMILERLTGVVTAEESPPLPASIFGDLVSLPAEFTKLIEPLADLDNGTVMRVYAKNFSLKRSNEGRYRIVSRIPLSCVWSLLEGGEDWEPCVRHSPVYECAKVRLLPGIWTDVPVRRERSDKDVTRRTRTQKLRS